MQYLLLAYQDGRQWEKLPAGERRAFEAACQASQAALQASGYLLATGGQPGGMEALTVRVRSGELHLGDGLPPGEPALLTGFFCLAARDLNEAVRIAAGMPQAKYGFIEVLPFVEGDLIEQEV